MLSSVIVDQTSNVGQEFEHGFLIPSLENTGQKRRWSEYIAFSFASAATQCIRHNVLHDQGPALDLSRARRKVDAIFRGNLSISVDFCKHCRVDQLAGNATNTTGLGLSRSEVLKAVEVRQYLKKLECNHHIAPPHCGSSPGKRHTERQWSVTALLTNVCPTRSCHHQYHVLAANPQQDIMDDEPML